jgi:hypothetical protein
MRRLNRLTPCGRRCALTPTFDLRVTPLRRHRPVWQRRFTRAFQLHTRPRHALLAHQSFSGIHSPTAFEPGVILFLRAIVIGRTGLGRI